jgi:signal transduction histidine kinase
VLWSSRKELIGQHFPDNPELERALTGEVVAHIEDDEGPDPKAEHLLLTQRPVEFVENYLPVYAPDGRRLIGVVELYRRPVRLWQTIHDGQTRLWLGALAGGIGLFLGLVWFVRRIERSLRDQQSRLVESEALAMVGELSAAVAHSIRNPLGSIRSSAELQRELGASAPVDVDDVIRQVDRIEQLVRTLLTYAREHPGQARRCDLEGALRTSSQHFAAELAAQGKPFILDWQGPLGEVAMEDMLLQQVLSSVLANAAEATVRGQSIRLSAAVALGQAQIRVEDEGRGITPDQLERVAEPFFTTKPRGLGLGLALARRAVERAGGRVTIERLPGSGTRVSLWLPLLNTD